MFPDKVYTTCRQMVNDSAEEDADGEAETKLETNISPGDRAYTSGIDPNRSTKASRMFSSLFRAASDPVYARYRDSVIASSHMFRRKFVAYLLHMRSLNR